MRSRPRLFAIVAALALLVRLLVPAGFMPQVAQGQVAIVACPGVMTEAAHAHAHGHDAAKQDGSGHDGFAQPCAFAAVAAAATLLAVAVLLALPFVPVAVPARTLLAARRVRAPLRWRPPLRAPPTIPSTR